jgi:hypothetical protein
METVRKTTSYEIFKNLKGNRPINELHVKRLMDSFKISYLISPIIVNSNNEVIDGQHRLEAAKRLSLPVYWIQTNGYGLKEVQTLNTNNKVWGKKEYLESYCELGLKPYLQVKEFMQNFPDFGIDASVTILTNTWGFDNYSYKGKSIRVRTFEEGKMIIPDLQLSYENAAKIMKYKAYYDGFNRSLFVRVLIMLYKNTSFSNDEMLKKLALQPSALTHCQNGEQYKLLIERIYNYRNRNKVNLRY